MGNTSGMEENKMQNITIGKSGIEVPFLGMGTWAIGGGSWWGDNDDALSVNAIEAAVEQGIRWIDTAPIYGLYHSEQVVGEALRHIDRDKVVLSTKCGLEWRHETPVLHKVVDGTAVYRDLSAQSIIEDVEESLKRLGTDHLDVLYTHWQSPDLGLYPLEETVEAMMKLKEQGKIRAIGASNVTADIIRGYCKYGQLDVIQEKYSLPHINPHKFRHTMASILYFSGADPVSISKRLGHADVSTTQNIYSHLIEKADMQSAEMIADAFLRKQKQA